MTDIKFISNSLPPIKVEVKNSNLRYFRDILVRLVFEIFVDYDTYIVMNANGFFHDDDVTLIKRAEFSHDKPITMTIKASDTVLKILRESGISDRDLLIDYLFTSNSSELLNQNLWYLLKAVQETDLPDGEEGSIEEGYLTRYLEHDDELDENNLMLKLDEPLTEKWDIEQMLVTYGFEYIPIENGFAANVITQDNKLMNTFIIQIDRTFIVSTYYKFDIELTQEDYYKLCANLVKINSGLTIGNFDLDEDTKHISFRTSIEADDIYLPRQLLIRCFIANISTAEEYYSEIEKLIINK